MTKDNFFYVPEEEAVKPVTGEVIVNNYWMKHPDKGLMIFYGYGDTPHPQCNPDEKVAKFLHTKSKLYEDCEIVQVEAVYMVNILKAFKVEKEDRKKAKNALKM